MALRLGAFRRCRTPAVVQTNNLVAEKLRLPHQLHPWLFSCTRARRGHGSRALCSALILNVKVQGSEDFDDQSIDFSFPDRSRSKCEPGKESPIVKVRLSVHYRVHSRQMLCIGGSQIPFGWSFLSIAKVPMTWNQGDIWTCEVELPASQRIEYKYVILEEQDWTKIENEDSEGVVEITYRTGSEPGRPPDIQTIQKQMAIVAWQPGPNRILQVPSESELHQLKPGQIVERVPAKPARLVYESQQKALYNFPPNPDPYLGTYETLSLTDDGVVLLDRRDIWLWTPTGVYNGTSPP